MNLTEVIEIRSNDRVFISGQSGTGKSTLARHLIEQKEGVLRIVLDAKDEIKWPGWKVTKSINQLARAIRFGHERIVFNIPVSFEQEEMERLFKYFYELKNLIVFADEGYAIGDASSGGVWTRAIATRGRSRGIGLWTITQRPVNLIKEFRTEANHMITFMLSDDDDRRTTEKTFEQKLDWKRLGEHGFYYKMRGGSLKGIYQI